MSPDPAAASPRRAEPPVGQGAEPFWDATRRRQLRLPWCTACQRFFFYPRLFCPTCLGDTVEWRDAAGTGVVYAYTVEHRAETAAFADGSPYVVALVELAEGVRLMANIVGCDPAQVRIDLPVTVCWEPLSDGRHLPLFTPRVDGAGTAAPTRPPAEESSL